MRTLKVISSNPNSKGGFVTKLQAEVANVDTPFGVKTKKETYYVSGPKKLDIDSTVEVDMNTMFRVELHPMVNPSTGEEFMAKWLHLK